MHSAGAWSVVTYTPHPRFGWMQYDVDDTMVQRRAEMRRWEGCIFGKMLAHNTLTREFGNEKVHVWGTAARCAHGPLPFAVVSLRLRLAGSGGR
mmetsp:Transcript_26944/g.60875  ORF Transcript_26944/g.60875 Transcript_26944/m.60875 type:complete len:94 (+) Transcript_26944:490-771(+)